MIPGTKHMLFSVLLLMLSVCVSHAGPPPADPDGLTRHRLDCGLEVWVHPRGRTTDGTGEVLVGLQIRSGALDEADDQRGAAFIAKQAAGLERPGMSPDAAGLFRSGFGGGGGPAFGEASRGHSAVSHAFVEYRLVFDADDARAWDAGLSHARALIAGWVPGDASLLQARQSVIDRDEPDDPMSRARMALMQSLFESEPIALRPLRPGPELLAGTTPDAVRRYIAERYLPCAATLVVVGDVDVGDVLERAQRMFGGLERRPALACGPAVRVGEMVGRVSVQTAEDKESAEVSLITFTPSPGEAVGAGVGERVASLLVGARLRSAVAMAEPDLLALDVFSVQWIRGVRISEISVRTGAAGAINAGLVMAEELARATRGGWTRDEHQAARAALIEALQAEVATWERASGQEVLNALLAVASSGQTWVAPKDALSEAVRVLASTTDGEIEARARGLFEPGRLNAVVLAPPAIEGLGDGFGSTLLRLARAVPASPGVGGAGSTARLDVLPIGQTAGAVDEVAHDPESDVWSVVLGNGVLVRVRALPDDAGALRFDPYGEQGDEREEDGPDAGVTVRAALCDGMVGEDARTLGRTRDAAGAWAYARLSGADASALRTWMRQHGLAFGVVESDHRLVLEVNGPPGAAMRALELAAALLHDPRVDARFVDRVSLRPAWNTPALETLGAMMLEKGDARAKAAPIPDRIDAGAAEEWLRRLARAPLEVAVVGDFEPESVIEGAAATLGTLEPRALPERPARSWGVLPRAEREVRASGAAYEFVHAVVFADMPDLAMVRPMLVASRVLDQELRRVFGEQNKIARSSAWLWLGEGIPGRVTLVARVTGDGDTVDAAGRTIDNAIRAIIDGGVADEVIASQIERARLGVDRAMDRRSFWADRLSGLSWNGLGTDAISGMREGYARITPALVRETLARCTGAGVHKRVTVRPEGAE